MLTCRCSPQRSALYLTRRNLECCILDCFYTPWAVLRSNQVVNGSRRSIARRVSNLTERQNAVLCQHFSRAQCLFQHTLKGLSAGIHEEGSGQRVVQVLRLQARMKFVKELDLNVLPRDDD